MKAYVLPPSMRARSRNHATSQRRLANPAMPATMRRGGSDHSRSSSPACRFFVRFLTGASPTNGIGSLSRESPAAARARIQFAIAVVHVAEASPSRGRRTNPATAVPSTAPRVFTP